MAHTMGHQGSTFFHEKLFGNSFLRQHGHAFLGCSGILPTLSEARSLLGEAHSTHQCSAMAFSPQSLPVAGQGWKRTPPPPRKGKKCSILLTGSAYALQVRTGKTCALAPFPNKVRNKKNTARKTQMLLVCSSCSCIWRRAGK